MEVVGNTLFFIITKVGNFLEKWIDLMAILVNDD